MSWSFTARASRAGELAIDCTADFRLEADIGTAGLRANCPGFPRTFLGGLLESDKGRESKQSRNVRGGALTGVMAGPRLKGECNQRNPNMYRQPIRLPCSYLPSL